MKKFSPVFITGVARSGSTLLPYMLSAHQQIKIASDPFFYLFKLLRNAIILQANREGIRNFQPESPLQDYYFSSERILELDEIQQATLDIPFHEPGWKEIKERIVQRAAHECGDLTDDITDLDGKNFREIFDNALHIIYRRRANENTRWIGCKEVWTLEFFPALARAYPDAKFIVIMRDPRAIVASIVKSKDESQHAHTLSVLRHWRKYAALSHHYQQDPLLKDRLYILRYEDITANTMETAHNLTDFLDVEFNYDILDPEKYFDYSRGGIWQGNSSFRASMNGITASSTAYWRKVLSQDEIHYIEFLTAYDMALLGYKADTFPHEKNSSHILDMMMADNVKFSSWRSDSGDPLLDFGREATRNAMLGISKAKFGREKIREAFLYEETFSRLQSLIALQ